jgi:pSer/pThr/pTyr-binding forkhead associated (FHA) protein
MPSAVKIYKHFETPKVSGVYKRLICLTGENKGKAYFLMGKRVVMGRSEKCDIGIHDLKSSREHLELMLVGKNYILTDLSSQNGVMINDLKVKQHTLSDGDKIIVGKTVYKFTEIEVLKEEKSKAIKSVISKNESTAEDEKNKKTVMILVVVIVLGLVLLITDEPEITKVVKRSGADVAVKEIDDSFARAIKQRNVESKKNKEKLAIYFKKGLREYREGNFFRAISEFESAQQWSPNDALANFYLRKTREKLDEQIEAYFSQAIRDSDAINYQKALTSYCAVVRILNKHQKDPRFISAKAGIKDVEEKLGMDEGEVVCVDDGKK